MSDKEWRLARMFVLEFVVMTMLAALAGLAVGWLAARWTR